MTLIETSYLAKTVNFCFLRGPQEKKKKKQNKGNYLIKIIKYLVVKIVAI